MPRLCEVRARAQRRTSNIYDTLFTRRVSAFVTTALIPLGVSPNAVSVANVGVGAAMCGLVGFGTGSWPVVGAALIHVYAVLDSVDGELARWFKRGSLKGIFLENWSAYMMIAAFPLAVALHLRGAAMGDGPLVLAIVYGAFARNAMPVVRRVALGVMQQSRGFADAEIAKLPPMTTTHREPKGLRTLLEKSVFYQTNIWVVLSTCIMASTLIHPGAKLLELGAFYFYFGGLVAKEIAILALVLRTPHIAQQMRDAYGDSGNGPSASTDAPII